LVQLWDQGSVRNCHYLGGYKYERYVPISNISWIHYYSADF
jgi:hypothetical protein